MAHLGNYYAEKILVQPTWRCLTRPAKPSRRRRPSEHLEAALEHWKEYAAVATRQYRPQVLTRVGYVDLNALRREGRADVEMAQQWKSKP